jgi:hypothetical protein
MDYLTMTVKMEYTLMHVINTEREYSLWTKFGM